MKVTYYLKGGAKKEVTALYAFVHYNGYRIKIYPGESINPKYWNQEKQKAKTTPSFPQSPAFNDRLKTITATIDTVYLNYKNRNNNAIPQPEMFKSLVDAALKGEPGVTTFFSYFQDYIDRTANGQRINPRTGNPLNPDIARGYQTTLNHLKTFASGKPLDFSNITLEFYNDFKEYLSSASEQMKYTPCPGFDRKPMSLSLNTIGSHIQRIKAVLAEATEAGANKNMAFKSRYFAKGEEDSDSIFLTAAELKEMENLVLSGPLDDVRDSFLIGAYTGQRFEDFSNTITPEKIKDGFIRIKQSKGKNDVVIPVHSVVKKILDKRGGLLPHAYHNASFNRYLKVIGKLMPSLQKQVEKTITRGSTPVTLFYNKWERLQSHSARRSFATNEYLAGTPTMVIRSITGHKTEKLFLKYIRVTDEDHAKTLQALWNQREMKAV